MNVFFVVVVMNVDLRLVESSGIRARGEKIKDKKIISSAGRMALG